MTLEGRVTDRTELRMIARLAQMSISLHDELKN